MMQRVYSLNEANLFPLSGSRTETVVCSSLHKHLIYTIHRLDIEEGFLISVKKPDCIKSNSNSICKWMCLPSDASGSIICCYFGDKASIVSSSDLAVLVRCLESLYILVVKHVKNGDKWELVSYNWVEGWGEQAQSVLLRGWEEYLEPKKGGSM
jgi:hypothetical protein